MDGTPSRNTAVSKQTQAIPNYLSMSLVLNVVTISWPLLDGKKKKNLAIRFSVAGRHIPLPFIAFAPPTMSEYVIQNRHVLVKRIHNPSFLTMNLIYSYLEF